MRNTAKRAQQFNLHGEKREGKERKEKKNRKKNRRGAIKEKRRGERVGWEGGGEVEGWGDRTMWYLSLFL